MAKIQIVCNNKSALEDVEDNQQNQGSSSSSSKEEVAETDDWKDLEKIFLDLLKMDTDEKQIIKHLRRIAYERKISKEDLNKENEEKSKVHENDMNNLVAENEYLQSSSKVSEIQFGEHKTMAETNEKAKEPKSANSLHNRAFCKTMQYVENLKKERKHLGSKEQDAKVEPKEPGNRLNTAFCRTLQFERDLVREQMYLLLKQQEESEKKATKRKATENLKTAFSEEKATEQKATEEKAREEKASEEKTSEKKATEEMATEEKATEEKATAEKATEEKATEEKATEEKASEEKTSEKKATEEKVKEEKVTEEKPTENNEDKASVRVIMDKLYDLVMNYRDDKDKVPSDGKGEISCFPRRTNVAALLTVLATMHKGMGNFKDAIQLLNEALIIRLNNNGENHSAVVTTLKNLAKLYMTCNMIKEANAANEQVSRIKKAMRSKKDQPSAQAFKI